uniref:UDP-N-acetylmuramoyl-L-alanine--D-glutamate ligase n=1 Tax=Altererythrobacter segetis TaxID=1104773 RepID=UPI00140D3B85|nr:UDP-N-acetylmuramoyl-L-alanine--D-glutamate ligase [Altererythrobacter segetis]
MIVSPAFAGKRYAVLGLARSGMATVQALHASGAEVTAWDRRPGPREEVAGIATIADPLEIDLAGFDGVVLSPGVPLNTHPIAARAREAGVPLIGDIELFALARPSLPRHKVVGITGTNGKSTTTALVHHLLETAGVPSAMGGNIGLPILGQDPLPEGGIYVLELSSYQLDLTYSLDCEAAALTNVTPDHLDRYPSFDAYAASKAHLFAMQDERHFAVFGCDDEPTQAIYAEQALLRAAGRATCAEPAALRDRQAGWLGLKGPHNLQNAAIASAIAAELGLSGDAIEAGLTTFRGLPHRMEVLGTFGGITFVNDSKATNPASTAPALAAYPRVHWIVGGLPKGDDLDDCAPHFGHVAAAYTIGEAGPHFADILEPAMHVERCEMLCEAVQRAMAAAKPGDTILLSPACASFDQFKDYEARGDSFRDIVASLTGAKVAEREPAA